MPIYINLRVLISTVQVSRNENGEGRPWEQVSFNFGSIDVWEEGNEAMFTFHK
jgi:hypothetical protein